MTEADFRSLRVRLARHGLRHRLARVPENEVAADFAPNGIAPRVGHALQVLTEHPESSSHVRDLAEGILRTGETQHLPVLADALDDTGHPLATTFDWRHAPRGIEIDRALLNEIGKHRVRGVNDRTWRREMQPQSPGWTLSDWKERKRGNLSQRKALSVVRKSVRDVTPADLHHSILRLTHFANRIWPLARELNEARRQDPDDTKLSSPTLETLLDAVPGYTVEINNANLGTLGSKPAEVDKYPDTRNGKRRYSRDDVLLRLKRALDDRKKYHLQFPRVVNYAPGLLPPKTAGSLPDAATSLPNTAAPTPKPTVSPVAAFTHALNAAWEHLKANGLHHYPGARDAFLRASLNAKDAANSSDRWRQVITDAVGHLKPIPREASPQRFADVELANKSDANRLRPRSRMPVYGYDAALKTALRKAPANWLLDRNHSLAFVTARNGKGERFAVAIRRNGDGKVVGHGVFGADEIGELAQKHEWLRPLAEKMAKAGYAPRAKYKRLIVDYTKPTPMRAPAGGMVSGSLFFRGGEAVPNHEFTQPANLVERLRQAVARRRQQKQR